MVAAPRWYPKLPRCFRANCCSRLGGGFKNGPHSPVRASACVRQLEPNAIGQTGKMSRLRPYHWPAVDNSSELLDQLFQSPPVCRNHKLSSMPYPPAIEADGVTKELGAYIDEEQGPLSHREKEVKQKIEERITKDGSLAAFPVAAFPDAGQIDPKLWECVIGALHKVQRISSNDKGVTRLLGAMKYRRTRYINRLRSRGYAQVRVVVQVVRPFQSRGGRACCTHNTERAHATLLPGC